ncbi:hypothetical protein D6D18_00679 [Aureobasidium pullulans]|nr:hypothetical protein D6D18_00679 [Aureobasidium pullulans]
MPPRPHDPFNDAPRRPASRTASHLHDTYTSGGHTLRANSAARNLFAPTLSRRPTTTGPPSNHLNELVLEDSDDAGDRMSRRTAAAGRATRTRRVRAATETTTIEPDEENQPEPVRDMVIKDERGNYLHEVSALGEQINGAEEEELEDDKRLTALVQEYWASGSAVGGRNSKRWDENELDRPKAEVMTRLRDSVSKTLVNEQWRYEPSDYMKALLVENHGRV